MRRLMAVALLLIPLVASGGWYGVNHEDFQEEGSFSGTTVYNPASVSYLYSQGLSGKKLHSVDVISITNAQNYKYNAFAIFGGYSDGSIAVDTLAFRAGRIIIRAEKGSARIRLFGPTIIDSMVIRVGAVADSALDAYYFFDAPVDSGWIDPLLGRDFECSIEAFWP
jgi:hypothetical protein